jgi:hypothetical protein
MALVDDGAMTAGPEPSPPAHPMAKKVFLLAAFQADRPVDDVRSGTAQDVIAVIGISGDHHRFEWVGPDQAESIANPALVTQVPVRLALPSPWHPEADRIMTGLVQLDHSQLGDGSVDDDIEALLSALAKSRARRADPGFSR